MPQPHKREQTKAAKHAGSRGDKHHQVPQAETKDKAGEAAQLPTVKHSTSGAAQTAGGGASSTAGLTTYADFVSKVREKKCHRCDVKQIKDQDDVTRLASDFVKDKTPISSVLKCRRCGSRTCAACGAKATDKKLNSCTVDDKTLTWCCSRGRLFVVWILLCLLDWRVGMKRRAEMTKVARSKPSAFGTSSQKSGGDQSPFDEPGFDGFFFGNRHGPSRIRQKSKSEQRAQHAREEGDDFLEMLLLLLCALLPDRNGASSFDADPPGALGSMLLHSSLMDQAAELLHNDSLEDATQRKDVYHALLRFMRITGGHRATRGILFTERQTGGPVLKLLDLSFTKEKGANASGTTSALANLLENLNAQSTLMLQSAKAQRNEFDSRASKEMLWLCREIYDLAEYLLGKPKKNLPKISCVEEVPDADVLQHHVFAMDARTAEARPGRMKRLVTEIASLTTGLPPGILIKHGESRLDVMKALIIGPADTPYELGLFEFDVWCPNEYPFKPPRVYFRYASGRVPINPNVHGDGMVCLSLLGTGPGEQWRPAESTILQILVSIQAMILCERPWQAHVPADSREIGRREADYMSYIQGYVVDATLAWLGGHCNPVWSSVVSQHFQQNAEKLYRLAVKWGQKQDLPRDFKARRDHSRKQLQAALQPYAKDVDLRAVESGTQTDSWWCKTPSGGFR